MANILIIEPDPEVRDLLQHIVRRLGHETVSDGADAADIHVVLVEPAAQAGLETARAIKTSAGAAVVCVSIYPPSDDVLRVDPVAYLLKPFSLVELERALLAALAPAEPASAA